MRSSSSRLVLFGCKKCKKIIHYENGVLKPPFCNVLSKVQSDSSNSSASSVTSVSVENALASSIGSTSLSERRHSRGENKSSVSPAIAKWTKKKRAQPPRTPKRNCEIMTVSPEAYTVGYSPEGCMEGCNANVVSTQHNRVENVPILNRDLTQVLSPSANKRSKKETVNAMRMVGNLTQIEDTESRDAAIVLQASSIFSQAPVISKYVVTGIMIIPNFLLHKSARALFSTSEAWFKHAVSVKEIMKFVVPVSWNEFEIPNSVRGLLLDMEDHPLIRRSGTDEDLRMVFFGEQKKVFSSNYVVNTEADSVLSLKHIFLTEFENLFGNVAHTNERVHTIVEKLTLKEKGGEDKTKRRWVCFISSTDLGHKRLDLWSKHMMKMVNGPDEVGSNGTDNVVSSCGCNDEMPMSSSSSSSSLPHSSSANLSLSSSSYQIVNGLNNSCVVPDNAVRLESGDEVDISDICLDTFNDECEEEESEEYSTRTRSPSLRYFNNVFGAIVGCPLEDVNVPNESVHCSSGSSSALTMSIEVLDIFDARNELCPSLNRVSRNVSEPDPLHTPVYSTERIRRKIPINRNSTRRDVHSVSSGLDEAVAINMSSCTPLIVQRVQRENAPILEDCTVMNEDENVSINTSSDDDVLLLESHCTIPQAPSSNDSDSEDNDSIVMVPLTSLNCARRIDTDEVEILSFSSSLRTAEGGRLPTQLNTSEYPNIDDDVEIIETSSITSSSVQRSNVMVNTPVSTNYSDSSNPDWSDIADVRAAMDPSRTLFASINPARILGIFFPWNFLGRVFSFTTELVDPFQNAGFVSLDHASWYDYKDSQFVLNGAKWALVMAYRFEVNKEKFGWTSNGVVSTINSNSLYLEESVWNPTFVVRTVNEEAFNIYQDYVLDRKEKFPIFVVSNVFKVSDESNPAVDLSGMDNEILMR